MDVQYPLMVVGTAERHIQIFNLTNPTSAYKVSLSSIKAGSSCWFTYFLDHRVAVEVADARRLMLHVFAE
jgi:hypothetical protein